MSDTIPPLSRVAVTPEQALVTANDTIGRLTLRVAELEQEVGNMEGVARRQKRNARQNETALRNDLAVAINRRG